jgi:hypothetical protein
VPKLVVVLNHGIGAYIVHLAAINTNKKFINACMQYLSTRVPLLRVHFERQSEVSASWVLVHASY